MLREIKVVPLMKRRAIWRLFWKLLLNIFPLNDVIKTRLIWHFRYVIVDFVNELRIIEQINTFYEFIEICF